MHQVRASEAKQSFGDLLRRVGHEPVAIERHKRVEAIVLSPAAYSQMQGPDAVLAERRLARARQQLIERDRLIRHHQIALDLLTLPVARRNRLIAHARQSIAQWRKDRLCSEDYIARWEDVLRLPPKEMARAIVSDMGGWGTALRQNSPWNGVLPA